MKSLVVEDDFTSRLLLQKLLEFHGDCETVEHGAAAIEAFSKAWATGAPFDLVCLDIMMPNMDGQTVLQELRTLESRLGILDGEGAKILMTTALRDKDNILMAFRELCDGYITKPIDRVKLNESLHRLELI